MVLIESSQKNRLFKKNALKSNFGCESYSLFKKGKNGNQRATWQVEDGPRGDAPPNSAYNLTFKYVTYEESDFYRISENHFYNEVTL
jgi:hypothetical protein